MNAEVPNSASTSWASRKRNSADENGIRKVSDASVTARSGFSNTRNAKSRCATGHRRCAVSRRNAECGNASSRSLAEAEAAEHDKHGGETTSLVMPTRVACQEPRLLSMTSTDLGRLSQRNVCLRGLCVTASRKQRHTQIPQARLWWVDTWADWHRRICTNGYHGHERKMYSCQSLRYQCE